MANRVRERAPQAATYSVQQVALLLGVSVAHVHSLVKRNKFPAKHIQLGSSVRFARSEIQNMMPEENLDRLLKEVGGDKSSELSNNG